MNLSVIVLASELGRRTKSDSPKVLHPVAGRPMLRYVVDTAFALQPDQVVVVVGHNADLVQQAIGDRVVYTTQHEGLGTAHALQQAEALAAGRSETVLVLSGDTPLVRAETLERLLGQHRAAGAALTLLTFRPQDPTGYGRIVRDGEGGEVLAVVEEAEAAPDQHHFAEASSGILCCRDQWLWPALHLVQQRKGGEYHLTDLAEQARLRGERVAALLAADPLEVTGLDDRVKLAQAEAEMRRRINGHWMRAGVTFVQPEATYVESGVEIGPDTVLWPNTFLQGTTRIGQACTVGPGAVIRDSVVGDRCRVELSVLEGAVMEEDSNIGPFSHLRKGARVGAGAHVGNFGEIKNSYLGPGAKMGHFSYLGDTRVGADANIGAGTITCNFDGQRKYRTVIGKGAFIGSDTLLVAPVEVGDGARTGAGAVVTHDVPAGRLAFGVPARVRPEANGGKSEVEERDNG